MFSFFIINTLLEIKNYQLELIVLVAIVSITALLFFYTKIIKTEKEAIVKLKKETESKSKDAELLDILIENIPYNIYFKDINSKFTRINSNQARILGIKNTEDAVGKSDFDFFDHAQLAYDDERKIIENGIPLIDVVEQIKDSSKKAMWVSTSKLPIYDRNGQIVGIVGITKDITQSILDRQHLIEAKRKAEEGERLKSFFFANMSHEIRTPMNAIIGFSDLLLQKELDEDSKKYLKYIINSGDTLLNLIDDIINIAKIEANQLKITLSKTKIYDIFEEIYKFAENRKLHLNKNELEIKFEYIENQKELIILTDEFRVKQILNNFVSNALKFTDTGSITIGYKILGNNKLTFFIKDTGSGIPKDKQKIIFQQFGQIEEDLKRNRSGTGLGLSITDNIVKLMNGHIWLESEINKGSTFFVELPIEINSLDCTKKI